MPRCSLQGWLALRQMQLSVGGEWKSESKDIFHDYFVAAP